MSGAKVLNASGTPICCSVSNSSNTFNASSFTSHSPMLALRQFPRSQLGLRPSSLGSQSGRFRSRPARTCSSHRSGVFCYSVKTNRLPIPLVSTKLGHAGSTFSSALAPRSAFVARTSAGWTPSVATCSCGDSTASAICSAKDALSLPLESSTLAFWFPAALAALQSVVVETAARQASAAASPS